MASENDATAVGLEDINTRRALDRPPGNDFANGRYQESPWIVRATEDIEEVVPVRGGTSDSVTDAVLANNQTPVFRLMYDVLGLELPSVGSQVLDEMIGPPVHVNPVRSLEVLWCRYRWLVRVTMMDVCAFAAETEIRAGRPEPASFATNFGTYVGEEMAELMRSEAMEAKVTGYGIRLKTIVQCYMNHLMLVLYAFHQTVILVQTASHVWANPTRFTQAASIVAYINDAFGPVVAMLRTFDARAAYSIDGYIRAIAVVLRGSKPTGTTVQTLYSWIHGYWEVAGGSKVSSAILQSLEQRSVHTDRIAWVMSTCKSTWLTCLTYISYMTQHATEEELHQMIETGIPIAADTAEEIKEMIKAGIPIPANAEEPEGKVRRRNPEDDVLGWDAEPEAVAAENPGASPAPSRSFSEQQTYLERLAQQKQAALEEDEESEEESSKPSRQSKSNESQASKQDEKESSNASKQSEDEKEASGASKQSEEPSKSSRQSKSDQAEEKEFGEEFFDPNQVVPELPPRRIQPNLTMRNATGSAILKLIERAVAYSRLRRDPRMQLYSLFEKTPHPPYQTVLACPLRRTNISFFLINSLGDLTNRSSHTKGHDVFVLYTRLLNWPTVYFSVADQDRDTLINEHGAFCLRMRHFYRVAIQLGVTPSPDAAAFLTWFQTHKWHVDPHLTLSAAPIQTLTDLVNRACTYLDTVMNRLNLMAPARLITSRILWYCMQRIRADRTASYLLLWLGKHMYGLREYRLLLTAVACAELRHVMGVPTEHDRDISIVFRYIQAGAEDMRIEPHVLGFVLTTLSKGGDKPDLAYVMAESYAQFMRPIDHFRAEYKHIRGLMGSIQPRSLYRTFACYSMLRRHKGSPEHVDYVVQLLGNSLGVTPRPLSMALSDKVDTWIATMTNPGWATITDLVGRDIVDELRLQRPVPRDPVVAQRIAPALADPLQPWNEDENEWTLYRPPVAGARADETLSAWILAQPLGMSFPGDVVAATPPPVTRDDPDLDFVVVVPALGVDTPLYWSKLDIESKRPEPAELADTRLKLARAELDASELADTKLRLARAELEASELARIRLELARTQLEVSELARTKLELTRAELELSQARPELARTKLELAQAKLQISELARTKMELAQAELEVPRAKEELARAEAELAHAKPKPEPQTWGAFVARWRDHRIMLLKQPFVEDAPMSYRDTWTAFWDRHQQHDIQRLLTVVCPFPSSHEQLLLLLVQLDDTGAIDANARPSFVIASTLQRLIVRGEPSERTVEAVLLYFVYLRVYFSTLILADVHANQLRAHVYATLEDWGIRGADGRLRFDAASRGRWACQCKQPRVARILALMLLSLHCWKCQVDFYRLSNFLSQEHIEL